MYYLCKECMIVLGSKELFKLKTSLDTNAKEYKKLKDLSASEVNISDGFISKSNRQIHHDFDLIYQENKYNYSVNCPSCKKKKYFVETKYHQRSSFLNVDAEIKEYHKSTNYKGLVLYSEYLNSLQEGDEKNIIIQKVKDFELELKKNKRKNN